MSGNARQFDVRAALRRDNAAIELPIECKSLKASYPLLLSCIPRSQEESFHSVIYSREPDVVGAGPRGTIYSRTHTIRSVESIYQPGSPVGKSTAQVGRDENGPVSSGDGAAFDKWAQAFASADGLIARAVHAYRRYRTSHYMTFIAPILVVSNETLWSVNYSEEGVPVDDPAQVDEGLLYADRRYLPTDGASYTLSHLHIYTRTGLDRFLQRLASDGALWKAIFKAT